MNELEKELKKEIELIKFTENKEENIKSNIYTKYKKHQRNKKILLSVVTCFFIVISSLVIVYADEIKETVDKIFIGRKEVKVGNVLLIETDVTKKLNYDSTIEDRRCPGKIHPITGIQYSSKCYTGYTNDELDKLLNIKLLNNKNAKENLFYLYRMTRNEDNKIKTITFSIPNIFKEEVKKNKVYNEDSIIVKGTMSMKTKYLEYIQSESVDWYNSNVAYNLSISKEDEIEDYYIKNLKVNAKIVHYSREWYYALSGQETRIVLFVYDDVSYVYYIYSLNNQDRIDKLTKDFLENLSY